MASFRIARALGIVSRSCMRPCLRSFQGVRYLTSQIQLGNLNPDVREFVAKYKDKLQPDEVYVCDGSEEENKKLCELMVNVGMLRKLTNPAYTNCWAARTDPCDVARLESKTVICTPDESEVVPEGVRSGRAKNQLARWMRDTDMDKMMDDRMNGCMKGRRMYIIPFSMGPLGAPLSKIGIQLTDSPYVVTSMRIMTRMGKDVLATLDGQKQDDFVRCVHSIGRPDPDDEIQIRKANERLLTWPCDPERVLIAHYPHRMEIVSYGSGYGGNSLLGKKCLALRIASWLGWKEGRLAEHMLILRIENPAGKAKYIAAAFPSACGKTNLAMMNATIDGWKVKCVGDDIAWMGFDDQGQLRAINPENGFFGVAPGTSKRSNPHAMDMMHRDTIFTNVAFTEEGKVYWEGMEEELDFSKTKVITWRGTPHWKPGMANLDGQAMTAAHPNSRFCTPVKSCKVLDKDGFDSSEGVVIEAILFGGRRPDTIPLVFETFDWKHGVTVGASMRSQATSAAADVGTAKLLHDPFAMRPFFGYNFGKYLKHWLNMEKHSKSGKMPRIFHVNWFQKDGKKFLWPGFGENSRVLEWIFRRVDGDNSIARKTPIGYLPTEDGINLAGLLEKPDMKRLLDVPQDLWLKEEQDVRDYLIGQLGEGEDMPVEVMSELKALRQRLQQSKAAAH